MIHLPTRELNLQQVDFGLWIDPFGLSPFIPLAI
ncbi:MAG: hypothetical protein RLZZ165_988 [Bacteroidota bacterium]|jgi:hypothetical protein